MRQPDGGRKPRLIGPQPSGNNTSARALREEDGEIGSDKRDIGRRNIGVWRNLPTATYDVILADPPWSYYGQQDKWTAAAKFYPTVADEVIATLPIHEMMSKNGILFLWATSPRLDAAMECLKRWKLYYRGIAFVWVKARKDGKPIGAQGIRPSIVKPTAEYVIAASKVAKGRPLKLFNEAVPNVILAPRGEHSQKPLEVHRYLETMYPSAPRLEMFARQRRCGWDAWGDEVSPLDASAGHENRVE